MMGRVQLGKRLHLKRTFVETCHGVRLDIKFKKKKLIKKVF